MKLAPPLSNGEAPPPDDVEALLRSFFRAEMPNPWPAKPSARLSVPRPAPVPTSAGSMRSKLALAASVMLLIAGSLAVSTTPTTPGEAPSPLSRMSPGVATRVRITQTLVQPKDKPTEWHIDVSEELPPGK
jgi:hypothetical protein